MGKGIVTEPRAAPDQPDMRAIQRASIMGGGGASRASVSGAAGAGPRSAASSRPSSRMSINRASIVRKKSVAGGSGRTGMRKSAIGTVMNVGAARAMFQQKQADAGTRPGEAPSRFGGAPECPVCTRRVYKAEKVEYDDMAYHKKCFKCQKCNSFVTVSSATSLNGRLLCGGCYGGEAATDTGGGADTASRTARAQSGARALDKFKTGRVIPAGKYGGSDKCVRCDRNVYANEKLDYNGQIYHRKCFKCLTCTRLVTMEQAAVVEGSLYCKPCFTQDFKSTGGKYDTLVKTGGGSAIRQQMEEEGEAPSKVHATGKYGGGGESCEMCAKAVYGAERREYNGHIYHKRCFKCLSCTMPVSLEKVAMISGNLYCKSCFERDFKSAGGSYNSLVKEEKTSSVRQQMEEEDQAPSKVHESGKYGGGVSTCSICEEKCYAREKIDYDGVTFHKRCFKCLDCAMPVPLEKVAMISGNLYCKSCFERSFKTRGRYSIMEKKKNVTSVRRELQELREEDEPTSAKEVAEKAKERQALVSRFGGSDKCKRCDKNVYRVDKMEYEGDVFHKACFKCLTCDQRVALERVAMSGGNLYCKSCFSKDFIGSGGQYSASEGKSAVQRQLAEDGDAPKKSHAAGKYGGLSIRCCVCGDNAYANESYDYSEKTFHKKCFKCDTCDVRLNLESVTTMKGRLSCKKCFVTNNLRGGESHEHQWSGRKADGGDEHGYNADEKAETEAVRQRASTAAASSANAALAQANADAAEAANNGSDDDDGEECDEWEAHPWMENTCANCGKGEEAHDDE
jgi:cysteine/glycine-rich protein